MKLEIEAKVKVNNLRTIAIRLRQLCALFLCAFREQDLYVDSPGNTLFKSNCGLRLRKRQKLKRTRKTYGITKGNETIFLTYKGPTGNSVFKSREEIQVQVDDYASMKKILHRLDYKNLLTVDKIRQIWKLGQCEICLDKVKGLGTFVEVEGPSEKTIAAELKKLGLDKNKHIPHGYARMLANKRR